MIWRFAAHPGIEAWLRDLAAREAACCPFLRYAVAAEGDEVVVEIAAAAEAALQPVLDMVQRWPDEIAGAMPALLETARVR